jgi:hypothetical protein
MPQTLTTPHRIAAPGGDVFVSHEAYIDHLYSCREDWLKRGERVQALLILRKIQSAKRGARRCTVCLTAQRRFTT